MKPKILVVDDEPEIAALLEDYFTLNGYEVLVAHCGSKALEKAALQPDIILLDINMPDMDGIAVCRNIRDFVPAPILFLTANTADADKIKGFGAGGDDYITKPFSLDELGARVHAHLRREQRQKSSSKLLFDTNLTIDYSERAVYFKGEALPLAKKEFDIIELLSQNTGQVFDKERIYELVWSWDAEGDSTVVAEHIRRIRAKFTAAGMPPYIATVWGVGYKWTK